MNSKRPCTVNVVKEDLCILFLSEKREELEKKRDSIKSKLVSMGIRPNKEEEEIIQKVFIAKMYFSENDIQTILLIQGTII